MSESTNSIIHPWINPNLLAARAHSYEKKVVFDFDETVVKFMDPFCKYLSEVFKRNISADQLSLYSPAFDNRIPINEDEFYAAFAQFVKLSKGGYGSRPPYPGMIEAIKTIKAAGIDVEIWTHVPRFSSLEKRRKLPIATGVARRQTLELIDSFGIFSKDELRNKVRFIEPETKAEELFDEGIGLIVEDHPSTVATVTQICGLSAIVPARPWNRNSSGEGSLRLPEKEDVGAELVAEVFAFFEALEQANLLESNFSAK